MTVELWRDPETDGERSCCSASAVRTARALAHRMGLPHLTLDVRDAFRAGVVDPWMADHAAGLTPNPCVRCNGGVRLDAMLDLADRLGAATLATGHYARTTRPAACCASPPTRPRTRPTRWPRWPRRARAPALPAGRAHEARRPRAGRASTRLPVAATRTPRTCASWPAPGAAPSWPATATCGERAGDVVDGAGTAVGRHRGAHLYTVGQRRGLGLTGGTGEPLFVLRTDVRPTR